MIKILDIFKFIVAMKVSDGEPPVFFFDLTCFMPYILSYLNLLLHACTELKSILCHFVCRKGLPLKKIIAISTLWWCFIMGGDKVIIGIILWFSGFLLIVLPWMVGICGPYIARDIFILSIVIGQFLI